MKIDSITVLRKIFLYKYELYIDCLQIFQKVKHGAVRVEWLLGFLLFVITVFSPPPLYCRVIHVPEDFVSVQEAIDESHHGDTVLLAPGTYYENVRMKDGITLEGEDAELTILADSGQGPPNPVVELSCDCTLKNLTVTGARGAGVGHAVVVLSGNPRVIDNIIRDNSYTGLGIHSEVNKVKAFVTGNRIYGNGGAGITNLGSGVNNTIINNSVYGNNNLGVVALDNGTMFLKNNRIRGNGVGVVSKTGGKAYIEGNTIEGNKVVGVVVKEKAFAEIRKNWIRKNGTPGINVDNSTANVYESSITGNGTIGVYYKNKSKGIMKGNIMTSAIPNILIVQDSELRLVRNKILGSPGMKNTVSVKNSKVYFKDNKLVGGIKFDKVSTVNISKPPPKKKRFVSGCISLF